MARWFGSHRPFPDDTAAILHLILPTSKFLQGYQYIYIYMCMIHIDNPRLIYKSTGPNILRAFAPQAPSQSGGRSQAKREGLASFRVAAEFSKNIWSFPPENVEIELIGKVKVKKSRVFNKMLMWPWQKHEKHHHSRQLKTCCKNPPGTPRSHPSHFQRGQPWTARFGARPWRKPWRTQSQPPIIRPWDPLGIPDRKSCSAVADLLCGICRVRIGIVPFIHHLAGSRAFQDTTKRGRFHGYFMVFMLCLRYFEILHQCFFVFLLGDTRFFLQLAATTSYHPPPFCRNVEIVEITSPLCLGIPSTNATCSWSIPDFPAHFRCWHVDQRGSTWREWASGAHVDRFTFHRVWLQKMYWFRSDPYVWKIRAMDRPAPRYGSGRFWRPAFQLEVHIGLSKMFFRDR